MKYFFLVEIIPLFITVSVNCLSFIVSSDVFAHIYSIFTVFLDVYPLLQAYGFLRLKDSKDPLQNISQLNLIIIMSKFQGILESFKETMVTTMEYKVLS